MGRLERRDHADEPGRAGVDSVAPLLVPVAGWGRFPVVAARESTSEDLRASVRPARLTRGLGRSYGDSSVPAVAGERIANSTRADRLLSWNPATGILRAEAGLSLEAIVRLFVRRGFFVPVTPGTKFVTLGGMVAADVHGKNHHVAGTFGAHVTRLTLALADGRVVACSPSVRRDLFDATVGGMGLTGHILDVTFRMARIPSPWIWAETERVADLDSFLAALRRSAADWPFTVGWIDCLATGRATGRGFLNRGRWASAAEAPRDAPRPKRRLSVPFTFPSFVLSPITVRLFNAGMFRFHPSRGGHLQDPESFFYPLDMIRDWNRIYGPRGFTQYQCVIPEASGTAPARRVLEASAAAGAASFLCVIKDCGPQGRGLLSFPMKGISIAMDLPVRRDTQGLVDRLNRLVIESGGRVYLAKDTFTRAEDFAAMEPRLKRFLAARRRYDPKRLLRSAQSVRLFGDAA